MVQKPLMPPCLMETQIPFSCQGGVSIPSVPTRSEPTFSFIAVVRDAITASSLAGAFIICTARTSSTGAKFVGAQRMPVKLIGELTGRCVSGRMQSCSSAGDVTTNGSDKAADCAHLKFSSTCC